MLIERLVAPTVDVLTLAEIKEHVEVEPDASEHDAMLQRFLTTATAMVEDATGRALMTQTWAMSLRCASARVEIPRVPVQSLTEIRYFDTDDAPQTATLADFYLFRGPDSAVIEPKSTKAWPTVMRRDDAITIEFLAGYGSDPEDVPAPLRNAVAMLVLHWYDLARAAVVVADTRAMPVPLGYESLINRYRLRWAA